MSQWDSYNDPFLNDSSHGDEAERIEAFGDHGLKFDTIEIRARRLDHAVAVRRATADHYDALDDSHSEVYETH